MDLSEGKRLADFSDAVRESTIKRLNRVPAGAENWAPNANSMSFADLAHHLIACDEWLFEMLVSKNLSHKEGDVGAVRVNERQEHLALIDGLRRTGRRRRDLLEQMSDEKFAEIISDDRFGGPVTAWWVIVRGNLDHEIHHRGEINAYLKMAEVVR